MTDGVPLYPHGCLDSEVERDGTQRVLGVQRHCRVLKAGRLPAGGALPRERANVTKKCNESQDVN